MLTASENLTHPETLSKTFTHGPQWTVQSYLQVASPGAKGRKEKNSSKASHFTEEVASSQSQGTAPTTLHWVIHTLAGFLNLASFFPLH